MTDRRTSDRARHREAETAGAPVETAYVAGLLVVAVAGLVWMLVDDGGVQVLAGCGLIAIGAGAVVARPGERPRLARAVAGLVTSVGAVVVLALSAVAVHVGITGGGCTDCRPLGRAALVVITLGVGWGTGLPLIRQGVRRWRDAVAPPPSG